MDLFTGTRAAETFLWERIATSGYVFGVYPRTVEAKSGVIKQDRSQEEKEIVGTATSYVSAKTDVQDCYLNAAQLIPGSTSPRLEQIVRTATRLRPLISESVESGSSRNIMQDATKKEKKHSQHWYFLHGEQTVWDVTATTLEKYEFTFLEDMQSREEILQGALPSILDPDVFEENCCMVWNFTRV